MALLDDHKGDGGPVLRVGVSHAQACSRQLQHMTDNISKIGIR